MTGRPSHNCGSSLRNAYFGGSLKYSCPHACKFYFQQPESGPSGDVYGAEHFPQVKYPYGYVIVLHCRMLCNVFMHHGTLFCIQFLFENGDISCNGTMFICRGYAHDVSNVTLHKLLCPMKHDLSCFCRIPRADNSHNRTYTDFNDRYNRNVMDGVEYLLCLCSDGKIDMATNLKSSVLTRWPTEA